MSKYTRSIRNILQANAGNNNITTLNGLYTVANSTLFPQDALNVISSEYRQELVTAFALHYMNDELGLETLALWKIALAEKLYNYGSYINLIYANIDKQVFADYRVRQVNVQGVNQSTKTGTGTITDAHEGESETNVTDSLTHSQTVANSESGTVAGTGTVGHAKGGSDTVAHTGTDANAKSGYDTAAHTGTDENAKTGYDTVATTGTDATAHTGTQGVAGTNSSTTNNTGTTGNDHNVIQINYDTPQGSLDNMRSPGGSAKGTGVAYANGQTYNYMSSAAEVDESNVQTDNTQQATTGSDNTTTTYNDTNTRTANLQDETSYHSTDTRTANLQDRTTYNSGDTRTVNLQDQTTYGGTDTETRNTLDTTSKTGQTQTTGSDGKTGQTTVEDSSTNTQTRNTTDTDNGSHAEQTAETDYSLNWEMLYKSMPLLNKLWDIFDDLFMCIY